MFWSTVFPMVMNAPLMELYGLTRPMGSLCFKGAKRAAIPGGNRRHAGRLRAVRFANPFGDERLRRHARPHAKLQTLRRTRGHFRQPLRGQPAVHAGAPRHPYRPSQFPSSQLGPTRALRQLVPRDAARRGHPFASRHRPHALFRGWRRHVSRAFPFLGFHPRPGVRPLEGDGPAAAGAAAREVQRQALRLREELEATAERRQPRVHGRGKGFLPAALLRKRVRIPRYEPRLPTTGSCCWNVSIRTSPSTRPTVSRTGIAPATTAGSSTGRTTRR